MSERCEPDIVPVPLPLTCEHGITVAWRYSDDEDRIDTRLAGWCPECGPKFTERREP